MEGMYVINDIPTCDSALYSCALSQSSGCLKYLYKKCKCSKQ